MAKRSLYVLPNGRWYWATPGEQRRRAKTRKGKKLAVAAGAHKRFRSVDAYIRHARKKRRARR